MNKPYLALVQTSNVISLYRRDVVGGAPFLTFITTIPTPGVGTINEIAWDRTGVYLLVAGTTTPFFKIYKLAGAEGSETLTALSNPATIPAAAINGVAWMNTGDRFIACEATAGVRRMYSRSGDTITHDLVIGAGMGGVPQSAQFSPADDYLYVSYTSTTGMDAYTPLGMDFAQTTFNTDFTHSVGTKTKIRTAPRGAGGHYMAVAPAGTTPFYRQFRNVSGVWSEMTTRVTATGVTNVTGLAFDAFDHAGSRGLAISFVTSTAAEVLKQVNLSDAGSVIAGITTSNPEDTSIPDIDYGLGSQLAAAFDTSATFLRWYRYQEGNSQLVNTQQPSTLPAANTKFARWSYPSLWYDLTSTPTLDAVSARLTVATNGPLVVTLDDLAAFFLEAYNADIAVTLGDLTAAFNEPANRLAATLDNLTASFGEGNKIVVTLANATAAFVGKMNAVEFVPVQSLVLSATQTSVFTSHDVSSDVLTLSDASTGNHISMLVDQLLLADARSSALTGRSNVVDAAAFTEAVEIAIVVAITDGLTLALTTNDQKINVEALIEQLVLGGVVTSQLQGVSAISLALALLDVAHDGFYVGVTDTLVLADAVAPRWRVYESLLAALTVTDNSTYLVLATNSVVDTLTIASSFTAKAQVQELLAELLEFGATILIDGTAYQAWVVNAESRAASEYGNFKFNSMAAVGDSYIGASDAGVYLLEGDDDAGDPIVSSLLTGKLDFGAAELKTALDVYLGYTSTGRMVLKTIVTDPNNDEVERWYELKQRVAGPHVQGQFDLDRGVKAVYWQFELINPDGTDFNIDKLTFNMVRLSRRV